MSAGCVRWMLSRTVRAVCGGGPACWTPASRLTICSERSNIIASAWRWSPFCTADDSAEETPAPKKKKQGPQANAKIGSVGRRIPQRRIHVISDTGENLGTMHRADVIRIMDEKGFKLVLLDAHKDPPVYQLMTGKQIHEKQMELWEKHKAKAAPVQVKELAFSTGISAHDLSTKLKQVESWLEKNHHVRVTLRSGHGAPLVNLEALEQVVQQIRMTVGFVSRPKVTREGQTAMCILRQPSAKERSQQGGKEAADSPAADSTSRAARDKSAGNVDVTEGAVQQ